MIFQYIKIVIFVLVKFYIRRIKLIFQGSWFLHRYRTANLLLSETISLCEQARKKVVQKERLAGEKAHQKQLAKLKIYADLKQKEKSYVRQNDQESRQES